jgi:anti-anti-sigma factor
MSLKIALRERKPLYYEIALTGRLDTATYAQLQEILNARISGPVKGVIIDLSALDHISSMGLRVIFKAERDLTAKKAVLLVTNMQPQVKRIFEIANTIPESSVFASIDEADKYYDMVQDKVRRGESI